MADQIDHNAIANPEGKTFGEMDKKEIIDMWSYSASVYEARIAELEAERNYERYRVDKLTAEIEGLRNDSI